MGLAPKVTAHLFETLVELRQAGVTVLMVEQNARSALAISDDGIVLEQGRLALAGSADEILADRRVGALFLGGGVGSGKNANSAFCRLRAMLTQKLFSRSTDNLIQIFSVTA